ncbi:head-tail connector protein [Xanthobacteraceae bacterium Astr-EGSB]|uniref:head-tail connector protein n=1 Tax=Astrobacterium formosum TaxID=3069710 RepID=UPI0027B83FC6|nr:head-tail connector protein [Xanthobacteraceae bacterium Astr-EGSB]
MPAILLAPPTVEPITLAEAKSFLRVAHGDDDGLIAALIAAARAHVETATRRALLAQTWRIVRDAWPAGGRIAVAPAPLIGVAAARVRDDNGEPHGIDTAAFSLVAGAVPAALAFVPWSLPAPGVADDGIEIDVELGHGTSAATVPPPLVHAVRLLTAHWYEHRGILSSGAAGAPLPVSITALMAPFRVVSL